MAISVLKNAKIWYSRLDFRDFLLNSSDHHIFDIYLTIPKKKHFEYEKSHYYFLDWLLILGSCSMEKRLHNKGFHLSKNGGSFKKSNTNKKTLEVELAKENIIKSTQTTSVSAIDKSALALVDEESIADPDCDQIILKNGEIINGKVLEYWYDNVRYKTCDDLNKPSQLIKADEVFMILYADGTKEVVSSLELDKQPSDVKEVAPPISNKKEVIIPPKDNSSKCDNIVMEDGNTINGKVLEITPDLIKYKSCDLEDSPLYTIERSKALLIQYSNGQSEKLSTAKKEAKKEIDPKLIRYKRKNSGDQLGAKKYLIASLLAFLLINIPIYLVFAGISQFVVFLAVGIGLFGLMLFFLGLFELGKDRRRKLFGLRLWNWIILGLTAIIWFSV